MHSRDRNDSGATKDEPTSATMCDDSALNGTSECGSTSPTTWGALFSPVLNFLQPCSDGDLVEELTGDSEIISPTTNKPYCASENHNDMGVEVANALFYDEDGDISMVVEEERNFVRSASSLSPSTPSPNDKMQIRDVAMKSPDTARQTDCPATVSNDPSSSSSSSETRVHPSQAAAVVSTANTSTSHAYVEEDVDIDEEEEEEEEFNPYLFIKRLPLYSTVVDRSRQFMPHLPSKSPHDPPVTLVLDLDETLVHCTVEPNTPNVDMVFPVVFHGTEYQVHVKKRPYLEEFLKRVHKDFEVVVFTASQRVYADELLDRIDPDKTFIKHRMFRESCLPVEGNYLKDLNVLGRDLSNMVLVDNSPHAFGYQVDNGIPIESWFEDPNDTELLKLEEFLRTIKGARDVRPLVREKFKTFQLIQDA